MVDSIFNSIKALLGIAEGEDSFDVELVMHINSVIAQLYQLGLETANGFVVTGPDELWSSLLNNRTDLEYVKTYIFLKIRLSFDPPQNSFLVTAVESQCKELEWRINSEVETETI